MTITTICKRTKHLKMNEMPLKARVILRGMTNNPNFPDAGPLLAQLEEKRAAMEKANLACLDGGRIATHSRKMCRRDLEHVLDMLVGYVTARSKRNVSVALSSGFQLRKPPLLLPRLAKPEGLRVEMTAYAGLLEVRWQPLQGVRNYCIYMNAVGAEHEDGWTMVAFTSRARCDAKGLVSGDRYRFRVMAVSAAGASPMSQVVGRMAG